MVAVRRHTENLTFEMRKGPSQKRRAAGGFRPLHVGELVDAASRENLRQFDLVARQHVKTHRLGPTNAQPRLTVTLGREGDKYGIERKRTEGLAGKTDRAIAGERGDDHDTGHVMAHHLFVVRYVERTHHADVTGWFASLVAHQQDRATVTGNKSIPLQTIKNGLALPYVRTIERRNKGALCLGTFSQLAQDLAAQLTIGSGEA